ncbi:MAG: AAA family ATPase [Muribaculaceae bacterium]|nr:AAA family ATPase [Muribaculaceae bacterium]
MINLTPSEMFDCRKASDVVVNMSKVSNPAQLWSSLWFEGEVACLFADTNLGKSIYAVQIANAVANTGRRVLYFDFEMSDKQFQLRYTDPDSGMMTAFAPTFKRVTFSRDIAGESLQSIVNGINSLVDHENAKVVIIDNITWLCNETEQGDRAAELMKLLVEMKRKRNLSVLVLAHTPKRDLTMPLDQNSLAGSKRLANFMDSIFAIGTDFTNQPDGRYLKQLKVRSAGNQYGANSVLRYEIARDINSAMLCFAETGFATEDSLLPSGREYKQARREQSLRDDPRFDQVVEMRSKGMTTRHIASELRLSLTTIGQIMKIAKADDEDANA